MTFRPGGHQPRPAPDHRLGATKALLGMVGSVIVLISVFNLAQALA